MARMVTDGGGLGYPNPKHSPLSPRFTPGQPTIDPTDGAIHLSIITSRAPPGSVAAMKTFLAPPKDTQVITHSAGTPCPARYVLALASESDRELIYRHRHEVYGRELGQHQLNANARLCDPLDDYNHYLLVRTDSNDIAGFISITPPGNSFSIDKYFPRESLPFTVDHHVFEVRLLTVLKPHRGSEIATLLMYAALRWVEAHGGREIVAIGRREVIDLYLKAGLERIGPSAQSGAVTYDLLHASLGRLRSRLHVFNGLLTRLQEKIEWTLSFPFRQPAACFHGGAFFSAIGESFQALETHNAVINADVLDAWFPTAPAALAALQEHLPWLLRTSPPTACTGLIATIARARGVLPANILPGAGSSDLIFRALRHWLTPRSHALILDPTYGEYAHVLEQVIGCTVDRLTLHRREGFQVDLGRLEAALRDSYDLVVLVNPNSPTGRHIPREHLEPILRRAHSATRIWVDETYVDYVSPSRNPAPGPGQSLEPFAARSENVIVCKSLSKVYALSGARAAYLCAGPHQLEELRAVTPPWVVSLPAQLAAVRALEDPDYFAARYAETAVLREQLSSALQDLGLDVLPGIANFLLCFLPENGPTAAEVVRRCQAHNVFLRDAGVMGSQLGTHAVRIAVKDLPANQRIVSVLGEVLKASQDTLRAATL
jgi:histidinol-phosphate/aromatic aminotransferase/cobyric acid decarboxylase-like protein/GNAT superfamily N-acetyltransferase